MLYKEQKNGSENAEDLAKMAKQIVSSGYRTSSKINGELVKNDFNKSVEKILQKTPYEILTLYREKVKFGYVNREPHYGFMRGSGSTW